jgi:hypothetical protein
MNTDSDTLLNRAAENDSGRREQDQDLDGALVEMGKVSDTKGGWWGVKQDVGAGFLTY